MGQAVCYLHALHSRFKYLPARGLTSSDQLSLVAGKIKYQQITSAHVYMNFKLPVI